MGWYEDTWGMRDPNKRPEIDTLRAFVYWVLFLLIAVPVTIVLTAALGLLAP